MRPRALTRRPARALTTPAPGLLGVHRWGLRRRTPRDLAACARLVRVVHGEVRYPVRWPEAPRAWLADEDVLGAWVVEREGELLGHVAVSRVGRDVVTGRRWRELTGVDPSGLGGVTRFFVRSRVRGQGIGGALLDVATVEIRRRGLVPVLEVVTASKDATKLFEDRGWRLLSMDPWRENPDEFRVHCYASA